MPYAMQACHENSQCQYYVRTTSNVCFLRRSETQDPFIRPASPNVTVQVMCRKPVSPPSRECLLQEQVVSCAAAPRISAVPDRLVWLVLMHSKDAVHDHSAWAPLQRQCRRTPHGGVEAVLEGHACESI